VKRTIHFEGAPVLPHDFPERWGYDSDFYFSGMNPPLDPRLARGVDEWGCVWDNAGISNLGEVVSFPIKNWSDFNERMIPDVNDPNRWECLTGIRETAGDKYLICGGISIYERVHFLRGLENTWADIYENQENLCSLVDVLTDINIAAIEKYAALGADGCLFYDDWGLQDSLMINPLKWREIWKPRYKRIFDTLHNHGMDAFLHSCGYIVDILDDLIEIGLDVIQMDQQENMGLELLGTRFGGRITFFSPVDIQKTLASGSTSEIERYCRDMKKYLATDNGGFIPRWYTDPDGAGHSEQSVRAMCDEFLRIS